MPRPDGSGKNSITCYACEIDFDKGTHCPSCTLCGFVKPDKCQGEWCLAYGMDWAKE